MFQNVKRGAYIEINLDDLTNNVGILRRQLETAASGKDIS